MKVHTKNEWLKFLGLKPRKRFDRLEPHFLEFVGLLEEWEFGENVDKDSAIIGAAIVLWTIREEIEIWVSSATKTYKPTIAVRLMGDAGDLTFPIEADLEQEIIRQIIDCDTTEELTGLRDFLMRLQKTAEEAAE